MLGIHPLTGLSNVQKPLAADQFPGFEKLDILTHHALNMARAGISFIRTSIAPVFLSAGYVSN
jgi:hypothetical protein